MNRNFVTQALHSHRSRSAGGHWQRWLVIIALLVTGLVQPLAARAETATSDAAGDYHWYITTIRKGVVQGKSAKPSLAVDPVSGRVVVGYYDPTAGKMYLAFEQAGGNCGNNNGWQCAPLVASGISNEGGSHNSVAFAPNGALYVVYSNNSALTERQLKGFVWSGGDISTATQSVLSNFGGADNVWYLAPVARWTPATASMNYLYHADYTVNGPNKPYIVSRTNFASWPNQSAAAIYDTLDLHDNQNGYITNGLHAAVDMDADGWPRLAFRGSMAANELWYAVTANQKTNCPSVNFVQEDSANSGKRQWQCSLVDPANNTGYYTAIYAPKSANDFPRIAYLDQGQGLLKLAEGVSNNSTCGSGGAPGWQCTVVDNIGSTANGVQLLVRQGRAVILYHDANDANGEKLKVARQLTAGESGNCGPSDGFIKTWYCSLVDAGERIGEATKDVGNGVTAALDKDGRIVAAYTTKDGDLVVARERFSQGILLTKTIAPALTLGETTTITYTLQNPNAGPLSFVSFYDSAEQFVSFSEIVNGCGGTIELVPDVLGPRLWLKQGAIAAQSACIITAKVTALVEGLWDPKTADVPSLEAMTGYGVKVAVTITAPKQPQSISFASITNRTLGDAPFALVATASSGLPVSFVSNTPTVCMVDNAGVVTMIGIGICTIVASQSGNAGFSPAPAVEQSFMVHDPSQPAQSMLFLPLVQR